MAVVIAPALCACSVRQDVSPTPALHRSGETLLERFLVYDGPIFDEAGAEKAKAVARKYEERLPACIQEHGEPQKIEECILRMIFGGETRKPGSVSVVPAESTVTLVLVEGRGSCAARVAAVLGLTEDLGEPFNAVVLRDHVLLVSRSSPEVRYETLEGGRRLASGELSRYAPFPPGGPIHVSGAGFVPYYLDNLAARYAEAGDDVTAARFFGEALGSGPAPARVHYNYGTFLLRIDRSEEAYVHLDRAIDLGWDDTDAYANRGAANWKLGRLEDARRDLQRALELNPRHKEARANLQSLEELSPQNPAD